MPDYENLIMRILITRILVIISLCLASAQLWAQPESNDGVKVAEKWARDIVEGNVKERRRAALIFASGGRFQQAIPAMVKALADSDYVVRALAARALARFEGGAAEAVPALIEGLTDPEPMVRWDAAAALGAIRSAPEKTVVALTKLLHDPDVTVRNAAAWSLANFDEKAKAATKVLREELPKQNGLTRANMARALLIIDRSTESANELLTRLRLRPTRRVLVSDNKKAPVDRRGLLAQPQ